MEFIEFTGKTVDDAITEACQKFTITSDKLEYEIIEKGTTGIFGFAAKPAIIKARIIDEYAPKTEDKPIENTIKEDNTESSEIKSELKPEVKQEDNDKKEAKEFVPSADPKEFLLKVFAAMNIEADIDVKVNEEEMNIELSGKDMGVLIGKRGQTLDSLQYLTSLVVNKGQKEYIRVKVDTENYRQRRKETLENLAKNLAYKAKRTKKTVSLEPMNPYERRIIHSVLQKERNIETVSVGTDRERHVVVKYRR